MTSAPQSPRMTLEEYFRFEYTALEKHEYRNGHIIAMSGGTYEHSLIIANTIGVLHQQLKGKPCRVADSNLRVRITKTVLYSYPDALVICGDPQFDPLDSARTTITNPKVVVEVLSPSSESYDRAEKFVQYLRLESLQEYVLISQQTAHVEVYLRQDEGAWQFLYFEGRDATAKLQSIGVNLPLSEIYAGVEFPPAPTIE
jgi:Uma2 family endonuclease